MRFNSKKAGIILALALFHSLASWGIVMTISSGGWGTGWKEFDTGEAPSTSERIAEKALMGSMYVLAFPLDTRIGSRLIPITAETNILVQHLIGFMHSILWVITMNGIVLIFRSIWEKRRVAV